MPSPWKPGLHTHLRAGRSEGVRAAGVRWAGPHLTPPWPKSQSAWAWQKSARAPQAAVRRSHSGPVKPGAHESASQRPSESGRLWQRPWTQGHAERTRARPVSGHGAGGAPVGRRGAAPTSVAGGSVFAGRGAELAAGTLEGRPARARPVALDAVRALKGDTASCDGRRQRAPPRSRGAGAHLAVPGAGRLVSAGTGTAVWTVEAPTAGRGLDTEGLVQLWTRGGDTGGADSAYRHRGVAQRGAACGGNGQGGSAERQRVDTSQRGRALSRTRVQR